MNILKFIPYIHTIDKKDILSIPKDISSNKIIIKKKDENIYEFGNYKFKKGIFSKGLYEKNDFEIFQDDSIYEYDFVIVK